MNKIRTSLFSIVILVIILTTSAVYASDGTTEIGRTSQSHCYFAYGSLANGHITDIRSANFEQTEATRNLTYQELADGHITDIRSASYETNTESFTLAFEVLADGQIADILSAIFTTSEDPLIQVNCLE